jgi:hypothetical protein
MSRSIFAVLAALVQEFPQHPQTAYLQGIELKSFAHASKKFSL